MKLSMVLAACQREGGSACFMPGLSFAEAVLRLKCHTHTHTHILHTRQGCIFFHPIKTQQWPPLIPTYSVLKHAQSSKVQERMIACGSQALTPCRGRSVWKRCMRVSKVSELVWAKSYLYGNGCSSSSSITGNQHTEASKIKRIRSCMN